MGDNLPPNDKETDKMVKAFFLSILDRLMDSETPFGVNNMSTVIGILLLAVGADWIGLKGEPVYEGAGFLMMVVGVPVALFKRKKKRRKWE